MTALEILLATRPLIANSWEWERWEKLRQEAKAETYSEDRQPMIVWAIEQRRAGAMGEYVKAIRAVRAAMGMSKGQEIGKYAEERTHEENLKAFDKAVKMLKEENCETKPKENP